MINVTKPFLPPKEEYDTYLQGIWKREWLTNNGPLVNELELRLKEYFEVPHLFYVSNGTIALQIAIKALGLTGEVITTPFSYVATTSSIVWEGCTPVFVDIHPGTLNINPALIEEAITPRTTAILATHVYGNPCDAEAIEAVAAKHNLRVIYDGAHAFGSKIGTGSVFHFGDVSTLSFHATKLFHTIEGGAIVTKDPETAKKIAFMRNFGHNGPEKFSGIGINGKNSEFHAAMGLCNLKYVDEILQKRKELSERYDHMLRRLKVQRPSVLSNHTANHAYYPVIFEDEPALLKAIEALHGVYVYPRRYFYPSLETLEYITTAYPVQTSGDISKRVLCLPLYHELSVEEVDMISRALLRAQNY
ncbi:MULTISPECIES: DegT/DnrJ/EryC1/StrS family aminotransferase [Rufibacter]|uniref:dTDP-4-amino-4,6-dideoxygalactose transaminase n=1 Tax=Rufibacter quisquiliarum TaxID=1549639 RepID=A0A839GJF0_9BACT|nr:MULTISPECIES: DegT/DnrJ/EryC1/StrS family aminotransferase [Rufibacter]MBA9077853.1 dTDP-4-amino-4,6-dideoxygalactose transaminase [Rufibacter quisquiliarum]